MNQAINFFWTIVCGLPVFTFWIFFGEVPWLVTCIAVSIISLFIPASLLQLSNNPKYYEGIGVKYIRRFVQNGHFANRFTRKRRPGYRIIQNRNGAGRYQSTIKMYERYHFFCLVFFTITLAYAIAGKHYILAPLIVIGNIIYNTCPILLQQYNKARLNRLKTTPTNN